MRTRSIGDIHGRHRSLVALEAAARITPADLVITLGCAIVLTTSFRFDARTTATLERRFAEHGIPGWIGVTPDLSSERWEEIREWVEHNAVAGDRLIVLDDREDADLAANAPGSYPDCHFFLADPATGLDEDLTDTVLRLAKAP